MPLLLPLALLGAPAAAVEGPWSLARGDTSFWLSNDVTHWGRIRDWDGQGIRLGTSVWRAGSQLTVTRGLLDAWEIRATGGHAWSWVDDPAAEGCAGLGVETCASTAALLPVEVRVQNRLVDQERSNAPGSFAWGSAVRVGQGSRADRGKVTGIGEGTTDLAAYFTGGREGDLSRGGRYRTSSAFLGRLRPGLRRDEPVSLELEADARAELATRAVSVVGTAHVLYRGGGVEFDQTDLASIDRFVDLSVLTIDAGGQILGRVGRTSFAVTASTTLWVRDNPSDRVYVGLGIGYWLPRRERR